MISAITITTTGWNMTTKAILPLMEDVYFKMAQHWDTEFKERHFTKEGAREYGYIPRKGERGGRNFKKTYTGRKKEAFGHTLPLVFTGDTMRRLTSVSDIRATKKFGRAILNAPTLNFIPFGGRINLRDEMTRVSDDEIEVITGVGNATLSEKIRTIRFKATKKVA